MLSNPAFLFNFMALHGLTTVEEWQECNLRASINGLCKVLKKGESSSQLSLHSAPIKHLYRYVFV
jgi:hypothetical protein